MRKILPVFLTLLLISSMAFALKADLTGTWEGDTHVIGPEIDLVLTLVLEQKGDTITGNLNDDQGYIDAEITEVKLEKNILTFKSIAVTPDGEVELTFEMTVSGNKMEGKWDTGEDIYGEWAPEKK